MLLAVALTYHEGALRASLMSEYGLRLAEVRSRPATEVADLVAWLPAGCAFWQDVGGPPSITQEVRELRRIDYRLQVLDYRERGSKGPKPKPEPEPQWAEDRRAKQAAMDRKAARFLKRSQGR